MENDVKTKQMWSSKASQTCSRVTVWQRALLVHTPEHCETLRSGRQHGGNVCGANILRHATRHTSRDPPDWLTLVCLDSASSLEFPSDLFQLIEERGLRAGILCSIPTTWTHLSSEHPASTSSASLVYILVLSPDWSHICVRTTIPPQPRSQPTRQLIHIDQNLSWLRVALFHSNPPPLQPYCFLSIQRTDWMSFTTVSDSTTTPFAFQIPLPILHPRFTQRQARQLESCLSFCWVFVIITMTV